MIKTFFILSKDFERAFCVLVMRTTSKAASNNYTDKLKLWWAISPPLDQLLKLFTQNRTHCVL